MTRKKGDVREHYLSPNDEMIIGIMEADWHNLSEKADIAYELGMLDEAEIIDAHADALAEWLEGAIAEFQEGGDLDVFGQEAEPSLEDEIAGVYARWCCSPHSMSKIESREQMVDYLRKILGWRPTFKQDISDDIIVEAARDAYETRMMFRSFYEPTVRREQKERYDRATKAMKSREKTMRLDDLEKMRRGRVGYTKNPPSWVTDEEAWERAYEAVEPRWETYDEPWAVVAFIYKRIMAAKARRARTARASKAAKARWKKAKSTKKKAKRR